MLFRKEAQDARNNNWSGKAVLIFGHTGYYVIAFTSFFLRSRGLSSAVLQLRANTSESDLPPGLDTTVS